MTTGMSSDRLSSRLGIVIRTKSLADIILVAEQTSRDELSEALLDIFYLLPDRITIDFCGLIETLCNAGANVNSQDNSGRTPLFLAVQTNHLKAVQKLIQCGADPNRGREAQDNQSSAIHLAAKIGNSKMITCLVDSGAAINVKNWGGNTPLVIAARFGQLGVIETLLAYPKCDPNICNHLGQAPLHYATVNGNFDIIKLLLKKGSLVNSRTLVGVSPLMLALERKHCKIVEGLLAEGANIAHTENLCGATPLHWAVGGGCEHCIRALLGAGADIFALDGSGRTSLAQAVQSNQPKALRCLLTNIGYTELVNKSSHGRKVRSAKNFFKSMQGNQKGKNNSHVGSPVVEQNWYLLHLCASLGHTACLTTLLDSGWQSVINRMDVFSDTPHSLAKRFKQTQTLSVLETYEEVKEAVTTAEEPPALAVAGVGTEQKDEQIQDKMRQLELNDSDQHLPPPVFKTYSPIKMSMINILKSAGQEQMLVPQDFDFGRWLDDSPSAFTLKVNTFEFGTWLQNCVGSPFSLYELSRASVRKHLGYRATEKAYLLDIPGCLKGFVAMKELNEIAEDDIKVKRTVSIGYPYNRQNFRTRRNP